MAAHRRSGGVTANCEKPLTSEHTVIKGARPVSDTDRLERIARRLEHAVLAVAGLALLFRLGVYSQLPRAAGASYGTGDVVDFALTLLLFLLATACAACGVAISARSGEGASGKAYRPLLIGITTFVVYYLVAPQLPQF
jgi:hypothetical protein